MRKNKALLKIKVSINVKLMYILADCGSLKAVYLLLKSVWKAGQICSFAFQIMFKILNGGGENLKSFFSTPESGMSVYVAVG